MNTRKDGSGTGKSSTGRRTGTSKASGTTRGARKTTTTTQKKTTSARPPKTPLTIDLEAKDITAEEKASPAKKPVTSAAKNNPPVTKTTPKADQQQATSPASATDDKKVDAKPAPTEASKPMQKVDPKPVEGEKKEAQKPASPINAKPEVKTAPEPAPKTPTAKQSGGGFFTSLIAAVFGGIIAIGIFYGLQLFGLAPAPTQDLSADLADLEVQIADLNTGDGVSSEVTERLDTLSIRVDDVAGVANRALEQAGEALSIASNFEVSETVQQQAPSTPEIPTTLLARIEALEARLSDVEATPTANIGNSENTSTATTSDSTASVANIPASVIQRLSAIETRLSADEKKNADTQTNTGEAIKKLDSDLAGLEETIAAISTTIAAISIPSLLPLEDKLAELETSLVTISSDVSTLKETVSAGTVDSETMMSETASLSEKTASLEASINTLEETLSGQVDAISIAQSSAQTVALANLQTIAANGGSFETALKALAKTGIDQETIASLQPYAESGLRSKSALGVELQNILKEAAKFEEANADETKELSPLEKLLQNATSTIGVKKVGEGAVEASTALNAMKEAFQNDDIDGFTTQINTLNDNQIPLFDTWLEEWRANLSLSTLLAEAQEDGTPTQADEPETQ